MDAQLNDLRMDSVATFEWLLYHLSLLFFKFLGKPVHNAVRASQKVSIQIVIIEVTFWKK